MRLVEKSKNMEAEYSNYLNTESHLAGCTTVDDIRDEFRRLMSTCKDERLMLCFQWDYELFSLCEIRLGDRENNGFLFLNMFLVVESNYLTLANLRTNDYLFTKRDYIVQLAFV